MVKKIFLILFFLFQAPLSNAETSNSCKSDHSFLDINKLENLNSISIEIKNSKKWMNNIFAILRNNGWIPNNLKKTHRGNINFLFNNGIACSFTGKIKFHGDNPDHLKKLDDFNIITSLNVELINSNIDNITEFKLFLPHTRGIDEGNTEVMTTNLLRQLNFFAPRTKKINVELNGINHKYLFQEKISKEFIESYGFTEGPIIEGDQRLQKAGYRRLQLGRVVNKNWAKRNWRNAYIALDSLSRINELYLKFYNSIESMDLNGAHPLKESLALLNGDNYESDLYLKNLVYDKLLFHIGGSHALVPDNRTFYFNYIENNFYPIYYDGDLKDALPDLEQYKSLISKISKNSSQGLNKLKEIKNQKLNYYSKFSPKKIKLIFFNKKPDEFLICNQDISQCNKFNMSLNEIGEIIAQRYKNNSEYTYIFVNSDLEKYKNNHSKIYENNWKRININEYFYAKKTTKGIDLNFDLEKKEIFVKQKNQNGRVIFFTTKEIKDWKINFSTTENFDKKFLIVSKHDLDGCITFYNSNFKNLIFFTKGGFCEDSINLIKSEGSIKEININDAFKDGLDMDFSKININNINVKNSGNDCVDVSFGNYKIKNFELENCFDNGISVGEKSDLVSKNLNIKNSKTGIAIKDSSKVIADKLNSKNNKNCFKIYNKKKEFLGGNFILRNMNCNNNPYKVENGSKFTLKNDI